MCGVKHTLEITEALGRCRKKNVTGVFSGHLESFLSYRRYQLTLLSEDARNHDSVYRQDYGFDSDAHRLNVAIMEPNVSILRLSLSRHYGAKFPGVELAAPKCTLVLILETYTYARVLLILSVRNLTRVISTCQKYLTVARVLHTRSEVERVNRLRD